MYYEFDESCVSDYEYDSVSHQLVELQNQATKEEFEKSTYYYAMHDFNGSTGFDIASKLNEKDYQYLRTIAMMVHEQWKKENDK
jgi:NAD-dependent DNA ligase